MIKASSLFYAVVISIIIAIVSSSFILFAYLYRIESDQLGISERLQLNAESGLNLLLSQQSLLSLNDSKILDLYGNNEDSVFLNRKPWGAFEVMISRAVFHGQISERIAQAGWVTDSLQQFSLYLADEGKPLAVCGNTAIRGNAYLPKSGVERAYIESQAYMGSKLIYGNIYKSKSEVPEFNSLLIKYIQTLLKDKTGSETDSLIQLQRPLSNDSLGNSFKNSTVILYSKDVIKMENSTFSGNIVIASDTLITVSETAVLNDIILIAPKIILQKEFKGQIQAFASDSILVEEHVFLRYPSVLGIVSTNAARNCAVVLDKRDTIVGSVFAHQPTVDSYKRAGIRLGEKSMVVGQVYSTGYAELKGAVYGGVMCSSFLLETPSSKYENHLLDAIIDQTGLPDYYTGVALLKQSAYKKVVKWVN